MPNIEKFLSQRSAKITITYAQEKARNTSFVSKNTSYANTITGSVATDRTKVEGSTNKIFNTRDGSHLPPFSLFTAILAGKIILRLVRFFGVGQGSSLPGMVALKIYPGILGHLSRQIRRDIVMVIGTNGKTTTNNMIAGVVGGTGFQSVVNGEGANLISGLATALLQDASLLGRVDRDYAFLEVDEASFPLVTRQISPDIVVVTNFFRDQLDRYGELDKTINLIREALAKLPVTRIVLNADDPLVAQLAASTGLKTFFYGLGEHPKATLFSSSAREGRFCNDCGRELDYAYYHYGQLGSYLCQSCGFSRPFPEVEGLEASASNGTAACRLNYPGGSRLLVIPVPGLYNLYNGLAAFTACMLLKIEPDRIVRALGGYTPATGRMERFLYQGKPVLLNLVKNPIGFNEGLNNLLALPGPVDVLFAINDNSADGRDVSWLWDVDFEMLDTAQQSLRRFVCCGRRGEEIALRLKYAGVPEDKITVNRHMRSAIKDVLSDRTGASYLFSTYTALWPVRKIVDHLAIKEIADG